MYYKEEEKPKSEGKRRRNKDKNIDDDDNDDDDDDDDSKTSDAERLFKNSSFLRSKVKLGSGLGLRNRGTKRFGSTRRTSPHRSGNSSMMNKTQNALDSDDLVMNAPHHFLTHDLCESCSKRLDYSIMNGGGSCGGGGNGGSGSASQSPLRSYRGEKRKTFLAVVYLFVTCLWTSFMLTVVHDRVPDMEKYPPLPDIILDNVPLIPWAFFATECIGIVLGLIFLVILVMHKYRWIIFRRMCSLGSTIFFLRSITMLITSLSVPGVHIQCSSQVLQSNV